MGLLHVPIDIIRLVAENLDPDDLLHLALCGHHFQYILRDQGICRIVLRNTAFSAEYEEACITGNYARELRRHVKRRDAIRTATPFQVLKVAEAAIHFKYANGVICYTTIQEGTADQHCLRILALQGPVNQELVIDIPKLLREARISDFQEEKPYIFKPLHHADGIISCLYSQKKQGASSDWLLVCNLHDPGFISAHSLVSTKGIFVRNNRNYLYYGTRSEPSDENEKCWVLRGLDLCHGEWLAQRLVLWDFIGTDIGSTICFEIFDDHFYGLSSQESVDSGEARWNSFYYAFRFRLGKHSTTQVLPKSALWRRRATEGPIDDRWSCISLSRDEGSGKIFIVETRKEFLPTSSQSQRTCYKKELLFPPHISGEEDTVNDFQDPEGWDGDVHVARSPDSLHHGEGSSSVTSLTFHNVPVRSYNAPCRAFVDLVNSPPASDPTAKRLRLRVRPQLRRLCQTTENDQSATGDRARHPDAAGDLQVRMWPAEQDPELPDAALDGLYETLNPQRQFDEVDWAIDDRFLVYSPRLFNHRDEPRPVVLVSFDAGLRLHGLRKWHDGSETCGHTSSRQFNEALPSGQAENEVYGCSLAEAKRSRIMAAEFSGTPLVRWLRRSSARYMDDSKDGSPRGFDLSR